MFDGADPDCSEGKEPTSSLPSAPPPEEWLNFTRSVGELNSGLGERFIDRHIAYLFPSWYPNHPKVFKFLERFHNAPGERILYMTKEWQKRVSARADNLYSVWVRYGPWETSVSGGRIGGRADIDCPEIERDLHLCLSSPFMSYLFYCRVFVLAAAASFLVVARPDPDQRWANFLRCNFYSEATLNFWEMLCFYNV